MCINYYNIFFEKIHIHDMELTNFKTHTHKITIIYIIIPNEYRSVIILIGAYESQFLIKHLHDAKQKTSPRYNKNIKIS